MKRSLRMNRRSFVSQIGALSAGAVALIAGPSSGAPTMTDNDSGARSDAPSYRRTPRTGVTDTDPNDQRGHGRGGDRRTAVIRGIETVRFPSLDGRTQLVGYWFAPPAGRMRRPAIVLLHGRSGAYSSTARGDFSAETLRRRDLDWARQWAQRGYAALIVDSFGPRGFPRGFAAETHGDRPAEVDEVTVRPLDAYAALACLRRRHDVDPNRIGLMGWSNGGSAVLAAMAEPRDGARFRIGVAFYPGCGLGGRFQDGYRPYAPVTIFTAGQDEEVSAETCRALAVSRDEVTIIDFPGATHDFDDPLNGRQDSRPNRAANAAAREQVFGRVGRALGR